MADIMGYIKKYGLLGFVATIATPWLLKGISTVLSKVPGLSVDLQSVSVTTTGVGNVINPGLNKYASMLFSKIPVQFTVPEWIMLGIGGAAFVILGAVIVDMLKLKLPGKVARLAAVFVAGGIAAGWIIALAVSIPAIPAVITMAIDALILAYILVFVDDALKLNLVQ